jgi:hypothetical protein
MSQAGRKVVSRKPGAVQGVVPLMNASWNQIVEELEESYKLKHLIAV